MTNLEYVLAHELGHCLNLNHTFDSDYGMNPLIAHNLEPLSDNHGVSYNNIMDYVDANKKFEGNTFSNLQRERMIGYLSSDFIKEVNLDFNKTDPMRHKD